MIWPDRAAVQYVICLTYEGAESLDAVVLDISRLLAVFRRFPSDFHASVPLKFMTPRLPMPHR